MGRRAATYAAESPFSSTPGRWTSMVVVAVWAPFLMPPLGSAVGFIVHWVVQSNGREQLSL
jgi:hypothetical protein